MENKCTFVQKQKMDESLANEPRQGKRVLEPLAFFAKETKLPFNILEDTDVVNDAEIHKKVGDLWQCLEGEVTFICGGELVDPWNVKNEDGNINENELLAKEIKNGTEYVLKPGDWLWIPAGQPHQHKCSGTARLVIIKVPLA